MNALSRLRLRPVLRHVRTLADSSSVRPSISAVDTPAVKASEDSKAERVGEASSKAGKPSKTGRAPKTSQPAIPSGGRDPFEAEKRYASLKEQGITTHPRLESSGEKYRPMEIYHFNEKFEASLPTPFDKSAEPCAWVNVRGRVQTVRDISKKLVFYDVVQDHRKLQVMLEMRRIGGEDAKEFHRQAMTFKPGDFVSFKGIPGRSSKGQLTLFAEYMPTLLSPCLHTMITELTDVSKRRERRHLDLMLNKDKQETLRLRHAVVSKLRRFFEDRRFIELNTPILSRSAGGALATPFITQPSKANGALALRIAPELWLKRLIIAGYDRVFEIGPQFRNEGHDATHSPEFTSCEFYQAFANIQDLRDMTVELLKHLSRSLLEHAPVGGYTNALGAITPENPEGLFAGEFRDIYFFEELEKRMGEPLPNWIDGDMESEKAAAEEIVKMLEARSIVLPETNTLPKLLDKLCGEYLEPGPEDPPTFIFSPPECLSPLAKSTICEKTGRKIACRMELFVQGKELVNSYEEENDPMEQKKKLALQASYNGQGDVEAHPLDQDFVDALEWGLPPTGGWGIGIDRLVMMMTGQERIEDVVTFGGMRG